MVKLKCMGEYLPAGRSSSLLALQLNRLDSYPDGSKHEEGNLYYHVFYHFSKVSQ